MPFYAINMLRAASWSAVDNLTAYYNSHKQITMMAELLSLQLIALYFIIEPTS